MARFTSFLTIMVAVILICAVANAAQVKVEDTVEKKIEIEQAPEVGVDDAADIDIDWDTERFVEDGDADADDVFPEDDQEDVDIDDEIEAPHVNRKLLSTEKVEQVNVARAAVEPNKAAGPTKEATMDNENVKRMADDDNKDFDDEEDDEFDDDELPHFLRTAEDEDELDFDEDDEDDADLDDEDEKSPHVTRKLLSVVDEKKVEAPVEAVKVERAAEENAEPNAEDFEDDDMDEIATSVRMHQPEEDAEDDFDDEDFDDENMDEAEY